MPERVFCVDFGAAYTKVALRTAAQETSGLVRLGPSALDFWAPTVVAADWSGGRTKPALEFGEKAAGIKPGPKIAVYTNFKKDLFTLPPAEADKPAPHPLEALLRSAEFEALAAQYSVLPAWVHALRSMVQAAQSVFEPAEAGQSASRRKDEAKTVTHHFFKWLHGQVMAACAKLPHVALNYEDIPLRVAVPVLAADADLAAHPGCVRLRDALTGTGWKLDDRPFVSEPESNAIGILSKATNALNKKSKINLGEMLSKGPLNTVLAGDEHFPTYRALLVDVGAFTTDFAALTVDTGGKKSGGDTTDGVGFRVVQRSVPVGVNDLDVSVRAALPEPQQSALDALNRKDFAAFQVGTYTNGTGHRVGPGKVLGGPADQPAVQQCLASFTTGLVKELTEFCRELPAATKQELILTGGGSNIPVVRDALLGAAAQAPGNAFVKTHAPGLKKVRTGPLVDPLTDAFARGGSALGGASIYFEKAYF